VSHQDYGQLGVLVIVRDRYFEDRIFKSIFLIYLTHLSNFFVLIQRKKIFIASTLTNSVKALEAFLFLSVHANHRNAYLS